MTPTLVNLVLLAGVLGLIAAIWLFRVVSRRDDDRTTAIDAHYVVLVTSGRRGVWSVRPKKPDERLVASTLTASTQTAWSHSGQTEELAR